MATRVEHFVLFEGKNSFAWHQHIQDHLSLTMADNMVEMRPIFFSGICMHDNISIVAFH